MWYFPFSALTLWLGDRKGIRPVKKLDVGLGLLLVMIWLELCTTYSSSSPVVTTTSIILYFNKHRLTQVQRERERERLLFKGLGLPSKVDRTLMVHGSNCGRMSFLQPTVNPVLLGAWTQFCWVQLCRLNLSHGCCLNLNPETLYNSNSSQPWCCFTPYVWKLK